MGGEWKQQQKIVVGGCWLRTMREKWEKRKYEENDAGSHGQPHPWRQGYKEENKDKNTS